MARQLHDELAQSLTGLIMSLDAVEPLLAEEAGDLRAQLARTRALLAEALEQTRRLILDLRPTMLDDLGLVSALRWYAETHLKSTGAVVSFTTDGHMRRLGPELETALFRIGQEALEQRRPPRPGAPSRRSPCSGDPTRWSCGIEDDGRGFDLDAAPRYESGAGLGLMGMRGADRDHRRRADVGEPAGRRDTGGGAAAGGGRRCPPATGRGAMTIRILIADDHAIVREGVRLILERQADMEVVGEATNGLEAVEMALALAPDVVCMDLSMPGIDGMEATRRIGLARPDVAVVALTVHGSDEYFFEMLKAGAAGYVLKGAASADLVEAVRAAAGGGAFLYPSLARKLVDDYVARWDAAAGAGAGGRAHAPRTRDPGAGGRRACPTRRSPSGWSSALARCKPTLATSPTSWTWAAAPSSSATPSATAWATSLARAVFEGRRRGEPEDSVRAEGGAARACPQRYLEPRPRTARPRSGSVRAGARSDLAPGARRSGARHDRHWATNPVGCW